MADKTKKDEDLDVQTGNDKKDDAENLGGLDDDDDAVELTLKSQDMQTFTIKRDIAMLSALIKTMWSGDKSETTIPLPNVRGSILKKVIKYMEYHSTNPPKEIEKPLKSANMREV